MAVHYGLKMAGDVLSIVGMLEDAVKTVEEMEARGILLRIMGAIAFRIHCSSQRRLFEKLDRPVTDIDFMASARNVTKIVEHFESTGHKLVYGLTGDRKIFMRPDGMKVDVFFDKLSMCHTIDFEKRLRVDYPTVPLAELLLEKMQIVKITEKDLKDVSVLLLEHEVADSDKDTINGAYIAKLLSKDWGFHYTTMTNLDKSEERSRQFDAITAAEKAIIHERIGELRKLIADEPKSMAWKVRAVTGTKSKWYRDVEDFE